MVCHNVVVFLCFSAAGGGICLSLACAAATAQGSGGSSLLLHPSFSFPHSEL